MSKDFFAIKKIADSITEAAVRGPVVGPGEFTNLASWLGVGTHAWRAAWFFRDASDQTWFCHADRDWQQTYLLLVGIEMRLSLVEVVDNSSRSKQTKCLSSHK